MKNKISTAFEQIEKKTKVDTLVGKLHTIMTAAIQAEQFEFYFDMITEEFDKIVNTFSDETAE